VRAFEWALECRSGSLRALEGSITARSLNVSAYVKLRSLWYGVCWHGDTEYCTYHGSTSYQTYRGERVKELATVTLTIAYSERTGSPPSSRRPGVISTWQLQCCLRCSERS
jgi:hypothetical protein